VFCNVHAGKLLSAVCTLILCITGLAACGNEGTSTPTPAPSPTPILDLRTPSPAGGAALGIDAGSPIPGHLTVGELADRIAAAWTNVESYRTTFTTTGTTLNVSPMASPVASPATSPVGSPVATTVSITVVDDVILPDRRHRTERANGQIASEFILVDGAVYVRGIDMPGATPVTDSDGWVAIDPAAIQPDSPYYELVMTMTAPPAPPYSGLSTDERDRVAHPLGEVSVDGRSCRAYRIADATLTGEPIDVVISIGDDDLPCSIETRVGDSVNTTSFEFNLTLDIEPPT
jgi:hypothetical protein